MANHKVEPTRRGVLTMIAVTAAGATMLPQRLFAQAGNAGLLIPGTEACILVPEVTEGPFYFDPALVRHDITEGKPGLPLLTRLQVVDTACNPFGNARVDIWHCDASGVYSGYANQTGGVTAVGETFLRGTQFTDADGIAEFATVYPGWYQGRTTHIHFKVFLDERNVLTGQIFFPEELNEAVYGAFPAYSRADRRGTFNANDGIAQQAGTASIATMDTDEVTYVAALIIGVNANAISTNGGPGGGFAPPGAPIGGPPPG